MRIHVDPVTVLAWGGLFGAVVAWSLINPTQMGAVAEEPVKMAAATIDDLFPPEKVDPSIFRHYNFSFDDSVSSDVQRTQVVRKIGHGRTSQVTIVTTPSGTYSSEGMVSPNVRYPGVETKRKSWMEELDFSADGYWATFSEGSFTYLVFRVPAART